MPIHRFFLIAFTLLALLLTATPGWSATLESPARGAVLSGLGFISGWKCNARQITVRINDGAALPVAMNQARADTRSECGGATNNGFIAQMNWMLLGNGTHRIAAYDGGTKFAEADFKVVTTGVEFLKDVTGSGTATLSNGQRATLEWSEASQSFVATNYTAAGNRPEPPATGLGQFVGTWRFTNRITTQTYRFPGIEPCRGNTSQQCLYDDTQNAALGTLDSPPYSYGLVHIDGSRCHGYFLREPQGGTVRGHYGSGPSTSRSACASAVGTDIALERYPTTGTRISSAVQSLTGDILPEDIGPEIQEDMETTIEDLIDALGVSN